MDTEKKYQIMRIARKYYELNMGQSEIAKEEGISKSTVSRLLQKAMDLGYIKISVEYPLESCMDMATQMKEAFHLKDVFITPVLVDNETVILQDTCRALGDRLDTYVHDEDIICVSWGTTMNCLSGYIRSLQARHVKIVQMNGGVSKFNIPTGAQKIVDALVTASKGDGYMFPVPAVVDSKEISDVLKKDSQVKNILDMARKANVTIFSVGSMNQNIILYRVNYLNEKDMEQLVDKGSVGDIASRFFNAKGEIADPSLDSRIVGLELSELKEKECNICVAVGQSKVKSLLAALRGGYIHVLYTDEKTAREVLREHYQEFGK